MEWQKVFKNVINSLINIIILVWILFPLYWLVNMSLKSFGELRTWPPTFFPMQPTFVNYIDALITLNALPYLINTFIVAAGSTALALGLSLPMAYIASRFEFRGKWDILFTILTFRFLPPAAIVIPLYMFARTLGLFDTHTLLIMIYSAINIPIGTWVLMSYFDEIPKEIEEAYMLDGYSRLKTFLKITLPLSKTGIIAIFMILFALSYGEYLLAGMLTTSAAKTFPVFMGERWESPRGIEYGLLSAAAIIALIPLIIIFVSVRKHLVRGLTFGAVR